MNPPDRQADLNAIDGCPTDEAASGSGKHWRYCLRCGHELINEKCKLRCPRCHYFMSCSDFDFANRTRKSRWLRGLHASSPSGPADAGFPARA